MATTLRSSRFLRWFLALSSCLVVRQAAAQSGTRADSPEYKERIRKALEEYELGNYAEAKLFFSDAHALFPNARTLRGLGLVAYSLRDYVSATDQLEQSIASQVRPLTKELRASTQQILDQSRRFEARIEVRVEPSGVDLRIDGETALWDAAGKVRVNPGLHEVVFNKSGYRSETRRVRVDAGAQKHLAVELQAVSVAVTREEAVAPPPIAAKVPPAPNAEPQPADGGGTNLGPWILIGASGAVAIGGGVLLGLGLADVSEVEGSKRMKAWSSVEPAYERSAPRTGVGITLLAIGGAGLAAGLAWQLWGTGESREVSVRLTPVGLQLKAAL